MANRLAADQGAILCDDPGLGKTIQTLIALVLSRSLPAVIVCPTSVKHGWIDEARHLMPMLKVITY
jgi:SNF2 family DNA or RNA helicase